MYIHIGRDVFLWCARTPSNPKALGMYFDDVAVIGGGFSGTMVAVNLAKEASPTLKIALIDRAPAGLGVAYGTLDPQHILNVRAGQMGAFADDAGHFWTWLQNNPDKLHAMGVKDADANSFIPRLVYGQYLQNIMRETQAKHPNLQLIHDEIVDVEKLPDGAFKLTALSGAIHQARQVVLALGNFPPGEKTTSTKTENPYSPEVWKRLAEPGDVLIIGTGLTSLDLVMTLSHTKKEGKIHLLSRRGLLPRVHIVPETHPSFMDEKLLPKSALELLRRVREEIRKAAQRHIPWQHIVDALRPLNQKIWENLNEREQRHFLRFLRAYWDVHRHRCAPEVMAVYERLEKEGRLILHRGHIVSQAPRADGLEVIWRPSGKEALQSFVVKQVVNCTGPQADPRKLDDQLVKNLLKRGLVTPDRLCVGIATSPDYVVLNALGKPIPGLYAMGSLLKGRLYESIAVPELRQQAAAVANFVSAANA